MTWQKIKPAEKRPQHEAGVDYSRERTVLYRRGSTHIDRRPGFTGWTSLGQTGYYPPEIQLAEDGKFLNVPEVAEGKITPDKMVAIRHAVANYFKLKLTDVPENLPRGYTLVWKDG